MRRYIPAAVCYDARNSPCVAYPRVIVHFLIAPGTRGDGNDRLPREESETELRDCYYYFDIILFTPA